MMVTWVTFSPTVNPTVEYNVHGEPLRFNTAGAMTKFKDGGWLHRCCTYTGPNLPDLNQISRMVGKFIHLTFTKGDY